MEIEHEDIRGFMPSMTMPLSARDAKEITGLKIGDAIAFRLNVTDQDVWIDNIKKIDRAEVHLPTATPRPSPSLPPQSSTRLREGDPMPGFELVDENGEACTFEKFRGQPLVMTFVFTRCPLPTFCPRMSQNFSELQRAIQQESGIVSKTRLLSVTIDPAFDTPKILKEYGTYQKADPKVWTFVTGDSGKIDALTRAFSVHVETEAGTISHGLATVLIDSSGRIDRIWRGNLWTPAQALEAIRETTK